MYKKSQITYFILFGFIILIAAGLVYYIYSQSRNKNLETNPFDKQPFELFIKSCIKQTGEDALQFISERGGYYKLPPVHYNSFLYQLPYYFYNNLPSNPTKEQVGTQLSNYMDENLFFCFRKFADFKKQGYEIEFNDISAKTTIAPNKSLMYLISVPFSKR